MHYLLRPGGGHRHLHLRAHVSVQRLRAQAEEADQRLLPNLPEAHQRCHQNIQAITGRVFKLVLLQPSQDATRVSHSGLVEPFELEISQCHI